MQERATKSQEQWNPIEAAIDGDAEERYAAADVDADFAPRPSLAAPISPRFQRWPGQFPLPPAGAVRQRYAKVFTSFSSGHRFPPWVVSGRITSTHTKCVARGNYFECSVRRSSRFDCECRAM